MVSVYLIALLPPHALPSVCLLQVVLLTCSEDPVAQSMADQLKKRTGCDVIDVGEEPLDVLRQMVEKKKLQWKDVAYMGKDSCKSTSTPL